MHCHLLIFTVITSRRLHHHNADQDRCQLVLPPAKGVATISGVLGVDWFFISVAQCEVLFPLIVTSTTPERVFSASIPEVPDLHPHAPSAPLAVVPIYR
jgi:hypothetical protein